MESLSSNMAYFAFSIHYLNDIAKVSPNPTAGDANPLYREPNPSTFTIFDMTSDVDL